MDVWVAIVSGGLAIVGLVVGHWLGRHQAHADRLRSLYADVLHAAIRATPRSFGYRVGPEDMLPNDDEMNLLRARLGVEREEDEDAVLTALVGAYNWSSIYRGTRDQQKAFPDSVPADELGRLEKLARDSMDDLKKAIRSRIAAAERAVPTLGLPWRRKPKPKQ